MIVLVSDNAEIVARISTLLKQKGDVFTVAPDEPEAFAVIRSERATLLIVDTSSSAFNGFALCGEIKSDPDLAGLPVLCLTDLSDLSSILSVLDCTADGFLTPPFTLASLSSATGDLLDRQAEGKAEGAVRTRFRVNHDGREFSVVADRRQLLEFLLTAFESAIRMRSEVERVRDECRIEVKTASGHLRELTDERDATVAGLHRELAERDRAVADAEAALVAQEQSETLLKTRFLNVAQELKDLGTVHEETRRSDEEKGRKIVALESDLAAAAAAWNQAKQDLTARVDSLNGQLNEVTLERDAARSNAAALDVKLAETGRQLASARDGMEQNALTVRSLTGDLETMTRERDAARSNAAALDGKLAETGRQLASTRDNMEQNARMVRSLQSDLEKMTRERDAMNRRSEDLEKTLAETLTAARSKEQEVRAALDSVTNDLNSIQNALEQNLRQLEKELALRKGLEQEVESLSRERDALIHTRDTLQGECTRLESDLRDTVSESGAREAEVRESLGNVTNDLNSIQNALEQNLRQLEKELALRKDVEQEVERLTRERDAVVRDAEDAKAGITDLEKLLAVEKDSRARAETGGNALRAEHEQLQGRLRALSQDLGQVQEENRALASAKDAAEETGRRALGEIAGLKEQAEHLKKDLAEERAATAGEREKHAKAEAQGQDLARRFQEAATSLESASRDIGVLTAALQKERGKGQEIQGRLFMAEQECADQTRALTALKEELNAVRSAARPPDPVPEIRADQKVPPPPPVPEPAAGESGPAGKEGMGEPQPAAAERPVNLPDNSSVGEPQPVRAPVSSIQTMLPPAGSSISLPVPETPQPAIPSGTVPEQPVPENEEGANKEIAVPEPVSPVVDRVPEPFAIPRAAPADLTVSRDRFMDIIKWAHHADTLSPEDRKSLIADLMRLSRLVQKGRHLTNRQEQEIRAVVARAWSLGYRFI